MFLKCGADPSTFLLFSSFYLLELLPAPPLCAEWVVNTWYVCDRLFFFFLSQCYVVCCLYCADVVRNIRRRLRRMLLSTIGSARCLFSSQVCQQSKWQQRKKRKKGKQETTINIRRYSGIKSSTINDDDASSLLNTAASQSVSPLLPCVLLFEHTTQDRE